MSYATRLPLYQRLSELRKRPVITYVTSIRPNMSCQMVGDALTSIIEQIEKVPKDIKNIDFLIISNGGDPITSLRIMSLLRERFSKIAVLLPYVAYSAATVLSLGADQIVMHPYSNLGPVDPQLTVAHSNEKGVQERLQFSSEDLRNYIDFIKNDVGITDQQHLVASIEPLLKDVGALPIGSAKRGQQLSLTLSEKMLSWHIKDNQKAKTIARALNSSYYHHGYAVDRKEAKAIGLPVVYANDEINNTLWSIWQDYSSEMRCDVAFDVTREIMDDPTARAAISTIPIVNLPVNTPPDVAKQILTAVAQKIPVTTQATIKHRVLIAAIESSEFARAVYNDIEILSWRGLDASLEFRCNIVSSGWTDNNIEMENS